MAAPIPTGAYIIRNKQTSTVLHVQPNRSSMPVIAGERDEGVHRESQIWWVEPLPTQTTGGIDSKEGNLYTITSLAYGALDLPQGIFGTGVKIQAYPRNGAPWQQWRLRPEADNPTFHHILNHHTGCAVDINGGSRPRTNDPIHTWEALQGRDQQLWEFVIPVVGVPAGYIQLQNTSTGRLLQQSYLSFPPQLIPPPNNPFPSQYRESWSTQWVLISATVYRGGGGVWILKNRLTGGALRREEYLFRGKSTTVNAWDDRVYNIPMEKWSVELDAMRNWRVIHQESGTLLEEGLETPTGAGRYAGIDVVAQEKRPSDKTSWNFAPLPVGGMEQVSFSGSSFTSMNIAVSYSRQAPPNYEASTSASMNPFED